MGLIDVLRGFTKALEGLGMTLVAMLAGLAVLHVEVTFVPLSMAV